MVDDFVDCKHGRKAIRYLHPMLEQILEPTYGVILYQEQVMRIASDMAGFSLGDADKLRRAMGKKNAAEMAKQKARFLDGAKERQVPAPIAAEIFDLMEHFAGYGFNKSHSASYAVLSARTAWLKAKHPAAFLAATLTSEMNSTDRVVVLLEELRRLGIGILPPDVQFGHFEFVVDGDAVRFGLGAIKNVGQGAVESILAARQRLGGSFRSFYQFCEEVDPTRLNRRVVESLILAGALDGLPGTREQKLAALDLALARAQRLARDRERGQVSLFGLESPAEGLADVALPDAEPLPRGELLRRERELIGLYLSAHPLDLHAPVIERLNLRRCVDVDDSLHEDVVPICGIVSGVLARTTRRSNHLMAFVTLEDRSGARELLCFHEPYLRHRDLLHSDAPLLVFCRATRREGDETARWVIEKVVALDDACEALARHLELTLPASIGDREVDGVLDLVRQHPGERPLYLRVERSDFSAQLLAQRSGVRVRLGLLASLRDLLGAGRVGVEFAPVSTLAPQPPAWKTSRKERQAAG
jgi:DNA polymerase-3 subunit alpha